MTQQPGLRHADVSTPAPAPRRYAFFSDTLYTPALAELIRGADLLYHEATFLEEMRERAAQTHHSTARQAAQLADAAEVKRLLLGHFSSRYKSLEPLLEEARAVFPTHWHRRPVVSLKPMALRARFALSTRSNLNGYRSHMAILRSQKQQLYLVLSGFSW